MFSATPKRRTEDGSSRGDDLFMPDENDPDVVMEKHRVCKSKYTHFHIVVFLLTFFSYALLHANRKSFSNVKILISEEWTRSDHNATVKSKEPDYIWNSHHLFESSKGADTKNFLGTLDTIFMCAYAVGLYISGPLGDRLNIRYVLCTGMWATSITIFLFAFVPEIAGFYSIYWYIPLWILNGLFQSTAWPSVVSVMGNWFGKSHRGLIFGIWSATASFGNIMGSLIVADFLDDGYEYAMLVPATMLFAAGLINFCGLVVSPAEVGSEDLDDHELDDLPCSKGFVVPTSDASENEIQPIPTASSFGAIPPPLFASDYDGEVGGINDEVVITRDSSAMARPALSSKSGAAKEKQKPVSFIEALRLPGVIFYSVAYACLKLVNYSFFFWLPYYLSRQFGWSQQVSDQLSVWYDVGGIIGGTIGGYISDKLKRSPVMGVMLLISVPILFVYENLPNNKLLNGVMLTVLGFFIGGVSNIISAAVCADLGRQPKLHGNTAALATVTGILDGTGSAGAALGQILVPVLQEHISWDAVFYMFIICTFLTFLCILPIIYHELREWQALWRLFRRQVPEERSLLQAGDDFEN